VHVSVQFYFGTVVNKVFLLIIARENELLFV